MAIDRVMFSENPQSLSVAKESAGQVLGRGAQGVILEAGLKYPGVVLKVLTSDTPSYQINALRAMISFGKSLDPAVPSQFILLDRLNLPLRLVVGPEGNLIGIYLPQIPSTCKTHSYDPTSKGQVRSDRLIYFQGQYLINDTSPVGSITDLQRWQFLASLSETVACMHNAGLVHGDLSMANIYCNQATEEIQVYIIDCTDGFIINPPRNSYTALRKSLNMYDPFSCDLEQISRATDVFVLGWWIISIVARRSENPGNAEMRVALLDATRPKVSTELFKLLRSAVGPIASRPSAGEFVKPVNESLVMLSSSRPPAVRQRRKTR